MKIYNDYDLTNSNSYKLKAICKTAYFPESDEDIHQLFKIGSTKKVLLGGGYNVILSKNYYDEEFVLFCGNYDNVSKIGENRILCEAGCDMKALSEFALKEELSGLEIYYDIPSSLGGAVVMNAGAGGEDIKGLLIKVWYYNPNTCKIEEITKEEIGFEYRNSFFQKNPEMIVCRALLELIPKDYDIIKNKMESCRDARWSKQPRDFPNAGSVFKRPPGRFVGPMIDELGLKGYSIGGAKVSEKHSGFIVNFNHATGEDILQLISFLKKSVYEKYEVDLEVEQRII